MRQEAEIDDRWAEEIYLLRERSRKHTNTGDLIAFYGSSSIRMWDKMADDLSPHNTINLGFGGSSYYWCNYFFEEVFEFVRPSRIVLYAGDNDLGSGTREAEILNNYDSLIEKITRKYGSIPVATISVKPSPDRLYLKENIEQLNVQLHNRTECSNQFSFIDIYHAMLDAQGKVSPSYYLEDQLHLNLKGYEIWKRVVGVHLNSVAKS